MMLLLLLMLAPTPGMPAGVSDAERSALVELFQATGGPQWTNRDGWLGAAGTECSWHGVQCFPADPANWSIGSVWSLSLYGNNLTGAVPPSLAKLSHLHSLDLWDNPRLGALPEELLRRWDEGLLDLHAGGRASGIREIRMRYATVVLCTDFTVSLHQDGRIVYWKEECKPAKRGTRPATSCQVKEGRSWDFDRVARLALLAEAEALPDEPDLPSIIDAPVTYLSVVHESRTVALENGFRATPIRRWTLQQAIAGALAFADWDRTHEEQACPSE